MCKRFLVACCTLVGVVLLMQHVHVPVLAEDIVCIIPSVDTDAQCREQYETHFFQGRGTAPYEGSGDLQGLYVAPSGWFVLVSTETVTHYVDLYNASCEWVYQLVLNDSGTILAAIDSVDGNLVIYPVRHDVLIKVDQQGSYLCSEPVTGPENAIEKLHALEPFTEEYMGNQYIFQGKRLLDSDSQTFFVKNNDGITQFTYTPKNNAQNVVALCVILASVATIVVILLRKTGG